ncbi:MBL fold metallo-hydrolase [Sphingomonas sp. 1P06PA]|uniref:MBL fold metallo-hydrolase n=1 Tax=Sphingomonas sp. 1P06PA TaxID=554121 RepID=UPI0039A565B8
MRRILKGLGIGLFFLLVAVCLAIALVPPFLDRIYYRGPVSAHFDGQHFFNPDGEQGTGGSQASARNPSRFLRFFLRTDRAPWPESVAVTPAKPTARVAGGAMRVTWIGHASALVQVDGLNILTDPIWSEVASPFPPLGPGRVRAPGIRFDDLPKIDLVLVSHNHYDHMDLPTLKRLWDRDRPLIVTSLGNDTILKANGIDAVARDWGQAVPVKPGVRVVVERVHHWGSRWGVDRNRALWSGFTVVLPGGNFYTAGDTGPGDLRWPMDTASRGPLRLALIPIGAFRPRAMMSGNHIGPVEAVQVFERSRAAHALAMHWGTFQLSNEAIDEPPALLAATLRARGIAPGRFRAVEVGVPWDVPAMR